MRQSLQPTKSVTLERQLKITVQSIKQKNRNVIGVRQPSGLKVHRKEAHQPRHVKHECTRGLKRKSFEMDDTNRLADYPLKWKAYPKERPQSKRKYVLSETRQDGRAV